MSYVFHSCAHAHSNDTVANPWSTTNDISYESWDSTYSNSQNHITVMFSSINFTSSSNQRLSHWYGRSVFCMCCVSLCSLPRLMPFPPFLIATLAIRKLSAPVLTWWLYKLGADRSTGPFVPSSSLRLFVVASDRVPLLAWSCGSGSELLVLNSGVFGWFVVSSVVCAFLFWESGS